MLFIVSILIQQGKRINCLEPQQVLSKKTENCCCLSAGSHTSGSFDSILHFTVAFTCCKCLNLPLACSILTFLHFYFHFHFYAYFSIFLYCLCITPTVIVMSYFIIQNTLNLLAFKVCYINKVALPSATSGSSCGFTGSSDNNGRQVALLITCSCCSLSTSGSATTAMVVIAC